MSRFGIAVGLAAGGLGLVLSLACADGASPAAGETIPFETFVSTYVDLRMSALRTTSGEIRAEARDSILGERGVTDAELFEFVDAHGRDATYMQSVWDSVEVRLNRARDSINSIVMEQPRS